MAVAPLLALVGLYRFHQQTPLLLQNQQQQQDQAKPTKAPIYDATSSDDEEFFQAEAQKKLPKEDEIMPYVAQVREFSLGIYNSFQGETSTIRHHWKNMLATAQSYTKHLHLQEGEKLVPGVGYIVVSTFAGAIVANRRNILIRLVSPVLFGGVAFAVIYPASWNKLIAYTQRTLDLPEEVVHPSKLAHAAVDNVKSMTSIFGENKPSATDVATEVQTAVAAKAEEAKEQVATAAEEAKDSFKDMYSTRSSDLDLPKESENKS
eukprot:NODE_1326_length_905_cov_75.871465_g1280_i0.p1 GENE.NODE_1326_length_905_cov_75.871465_g1280_i0~~NODE_1326_length_905_cov_75.871465_g1280_i0.p1  ORF type:complete len:285 (+),score=59.28 NODE_1326_length_905_cov_75.871465_g1280_i0:68-856(+)